jgi:hypothetical protein
LLHHIKNKLKIADPRLTKASYVRRFLVVKGNDVAKAQKLYEEHLKFRIDNKIEELAKDDWAKHLATFKKLYPRSYYYTDKEGRPLLIESLGRAKFSELFKVTD